MNEFIYFHHQINPLASTGQCNEDWIFQELQDCYGNINVDQLKTVARLAPLPLPEIEAVLQRLQAQAPIWMLSNYIAPWLRATMEHLQLEQYFEQLFISSEIGCRKPAPLSFQKVLDAWRGPAASIIFVDDKEENLHQARVLGMRTVHSLRLPLEWEKKTQQWLQK